MLRPISFPSRRGVTQIGCQCRLKYRLIHVSSSRRVENNENGGPGPKYEVTETPAPKSDNGMAGNGAHSFSDSEALPLPHQSHKVSELSHDRIGSAGEQENLVVDQCNKLFLLN